MKRAFSLALLLVAPALSAALTTSFSPRQVTLAGATPEAPVLVLRGSFTHTDRGMRRSFVTITANADANGVAHFAITEEKTIHTVWLFIDATTGRSLAAAPSGEPLHQIPSEATTLKHDAEGQIEAMLTNANGVYLLLVRPPGNAWSQGFYDGANDEDHTTNGVIKPSFTSLRTVLGSAEPPKKLRNGDVIALLDTTHLLYWMSTVGPEGRQ